MEQPGTSTTLLGRLGHWCARRRWWVLGAWVVALVGLTLLGAALGGKPSDNLSVPGLPAADGAAVLQRAFPGQGAADGQVVVRSVGAPLAATADRDAVLAAARDLRRVPGIASVSLPGPPGTVSADGRTALIGIESDTVGNWATRKQIPYTTYADLSAKPEVEKLIADVVAEANVELAQVETIKAFRLLQKELDQEDGEMTATQKVKRAAIAAEFADLIDSMYKGA